MTSQQLPAGFLEDLIGDLRSALGADLRAVYLYGSVATGGFDEGVSDIDLLVVTEHDLAPEVVALVEAFHRQTIERHPDWDDRLELICVGRDTLARFRDGGNIGVISPGEPFHVRDGVELWLENLYLVRETGVTLMGPSPIETIPFIPRHDFLAAIRRYADEVSSRNLREMAPRDRAYCVLTMCRAFRTLQTGRPCSKQEGASWVREHMPEWAALVDSAEQCRLSRGRLGLADDESRQSAETLIGLLRAAIDRNATGRAR